MKRSRGEAEGAGGAEVSKPGDDDPENGPHHARPQELRNTSDAGNAAIQKQNSEQANAHGQQSAGRYQHMAFERAKQRNGQPQVAAEVAVLERRPYVAGVLRKSQAAGGDGKRSAERELPNKKKRDELPQAFRPVNLAQVAVGAAGTRHSGAQF